MTQLSSEALHAGLVLGDYRLEGLLARGGMGVVYTARQVSVDRRVALKVIAPAFAEDESFRRRFESESRAAIEIEHPNVVPVYATGAAEGLLFIAMRYIDGRDLRRVVDAESPMSPARVLALLEQIASGLDAAHRKGLVHRDVKPANVMIERLGVDREHCYMLDFGIAKQRGSGGLTRTGGWVGTLDYVAPEQILDRDVDARTDVYALGATFFHMVTGQPPYAMRDDGAKLYAHVNARAPRVTDIRAELPAAVDEVVARALAKEPAKRYPSAGDFARAAHAAVTGSTPSVSEQTVATGEAAPNKAAERTSLQVPPGRPERTYLSGGQPPPGRAVQDVTVGGHTTGGEHGVGSTTRDRLKKRRTARWPLPLAVGLALLALAGAGAAVLVSRRSGSNTHQAASRRFPVHRSTARPAHAQHRPAGHRKPQTTVRHASQAFVSAAQPRLVARRHGTAVRHASQASSPVTQPPLVAGGHGTVTLLGEIGQLSFGASTAKDVERFAGTPEASVRGAVEAWLPPYRALGYQCGASEGSRKRSMTSKPSAPYYCTTVYYLNSITGVLVAFWSSSPSFHTSNGTHPGISGAEAERQENQEINKNGCHVDIALGGRSQQSTLLIDVSQAGIVTALDDEAAHDRLGLQLCTSAPGGAGTKPNSGP